MMKQAGINPKLLIPALLCGVMGLIFEFAPYPDSAGFFSLKNIAGLLSVVDFAFFSSNLFYADKMDFPINLLNCAFYILLIIGYVIYQTSKKKEIRLLRFCLAIILFANLIFFASSIIIRFTHDYTAYELKAPIWRWLLYKAINLFWAFYAWFVLRKLSADRQLQTITYKPDTGGLVTTNYVEATKWQRFFHFVLDSCLAILLLSQLSRWGFLSDFLQNISTTLPEELTLSIGLLLFRLAYYLFFESVLGATPAKLLTETRVTGNEGEQKGFGSIVGRTFSRMVPFEPLSFFGRGWHDNWTDTYVLKEVRTGYKPSFFLLVIALVCLLVKIPLWGLDAYQNYQDRKASEKAQSYLVEAYEREYRHLSTGHVFEVQYETGLGSQYEYIKVEDVQPSTIKVCRFTLPKNDYTRTGGAIMDAYWMAKDAPQNMLELDRATVLLAAQKEFGPSQNDAPPKAYLFKDGSDVTIKRLFRIDRPFIILGENTYASWINNSGTLGLSFKNIGIGGTIVAIQNTIGDTRWTNALPQILESSARGYDAKFAISSDHYTTGTDYRFIITLEFDKGQSCKYVVEGNGTRYTVLPLYD
jgi:uncharacterized RDD family membrane protein YckC